MSNNYKLNTSKIEKLRSENKIPVIEGFIHKKKISKHNKNKEVLAFPGIAFPDKFLKP